MKDTQIATPVKHSFWDREARGYSLMTLPAFLNHAASCSQTVIPKKQWKNIRICGLSDGLKAFGLL